ncbi:MAG: 5'/3'-nucleotidase SurE [Candidatus Omnitrophica bacterium]|nr:5'/3'-nucleotidase SurE [Candidatus Omnitrophota bacterium]
MKILLTNDDGIEAQGIQALMNFFKDRCELVLAAPADERSATSHSISLGKDLRVRDYIKHGIPHYAVHGMPVDCVKFALSEIPGFQPDLVISGINHGANTGVSVYYSGTISAAREAMINRVPAMAISLCSREFRDFTASTEIAGQLVDGFKEGAFPKDVLLSVNVPGVQSGLICGVKITKQADSRFIEEFIYKSSKQGEKIYQLAGEIEIDETDGTSDEEAVLENYISITPLRIDLTDQSAIPPLEKWLRHKKINQS